MDDQARGDQPSEVTPAPALEDLVLISATPEENKPWYRYPEFDAFFVTSLFIFAVALFDEAFGMRDACLFIAGLAAVYMVSCTIRRARI